MESITNLIYVQGDIFLTFINMFVLVFIFDFIISFANAIKVIKECVS